MTASTTSGPGADIVQRVRGRVRRRVLGRLHKPRLTLVDEPRPGARAVVSRITERPLPTCRQVVASTTWWGARLATLIPRVPLLLLREIRPTVRGAGRAGRAWARWVACAELADAARKAEGNIRAKAGADVEDRRSGRMKVSVAVGVAWTAWWLWLWLTHPAAGVALALVVAAALDLAGRAGAPQDRPVLLPTGPIREGVPLSSLRAEIAKTLLNEGVEATVAQPQPVDHGWTVPYHAAGVITDDHMRALERALQIRRNGIAQIVDRGNAARGELRVSLRDPLAELVPSPEFDSLTLYQPLPLGRIADGTEWAESFLRTHFSVIGASQSGKSSGLWQCTDVLRRCPEQELDGIDLTDGPAFSACRRAFRARATDRNGALRILREAVALIKARAAELSRLAEDDDTPDDYDEKHQPSAEAPQRTVLIDEFARVAEDEDLLGLVIYILRYGAKTAVTLGLAGQGTTLDDFGSSVVRGQIMLKILCACSRSDVLTLFGKDARDSGYRPDLLEVADGQDPHDAGKCFAQSSRSRKPIMRRFYRLDQAEVRRRDRRAGSRAVAAGAVLEAVEVPPVLAAVESAFRAAGDPDRLTTVDLLQWLRTAGMDFDLDNKAAGTHLAERLRPVQVRPEARWRPTPGANSVRGYWLADVRAAVRRMT